MADTQRTDAELLTRFADNNIGGITAQDLRDLVVSKVNLDNQLGDLTYVGSWDADTNTPTIPAASSGNLGFYYIVSVAGTTTIDGISDWEVTDMLVSDGTSWTQFRREPVVTAEGYASDAEASAIAAALSESNAATSEGNAALSASASATSEANAAASEASASADATTASVDANRAEAALNTIESYIIPEGAAYSTSESDVLNSLMTEAEFMALAAKRRDDNAGSGSLSSIAFDDFYSPELTANTLPIAEAEKCINGVKHILSATDLLFPAASSVYTLPERQDLVFLESWHEKVSDKDIVYPYGNTQSLVATDESTGLTTVDGSFSGYDTYSLFGNWQSAGALIGKCLVWSTLSDANKKKFVSDPDNNVYLGSDGELRQVRYAVRTLDLNGAGYTEATAMAEAGFTQDLVDKGLWWNGDVSAVGVALVSRRNQGAYHPVFNPSGTKRIKSSNSSYGHYFYSSLLTVEIMSVADCFDSTNLPTGSTGYIATTYSGRPDSKYYDAIYEGDVLDLRNSSHKQDLQRTLERSKEKALSKEFRGEEFERDMYRLTPNLVNNPTQYNSNYLTQIYVYAKELQRSDYGANDDGRWYYEDWVVGSKVFIRDKTRNLEGYGYVSSRTVSTTVLKPVFGSIVNSGIPAAGNEVYMMLMVPSERKSAGEITRCALIGDPANYYRGSYAFLSTDGITDLEAGEVVLVVEGALGNVGNPGIAGHFYKKISGTTASYSLATGWDYANTNNFTDLGTDREDSWFINRVGVEPLLVAEDGTSYLPNNSTHAYKMPHSVSNGDVLHISSVDQGNTWEVSTQVITEATGETAALSAESSRLRLIWYLSPTDETIAYVAPDEILLDGDVIASDSSRIGDYLNFGKVFVGTSSDEQMIPLKKVDGVWTHTISSLTSGFKASFQLARWGQQLGLVVAGEEIDTVDDGAIDTAVNCRRIMLPFFVREDV